MMSASASSYAMEMAGTMSVPKSIAKISTVLRGIGVKKTIQHNSPGDSTTRGLCTPNSHFASRIRSNESNNVQTLPVDLAPMEDVPLYNQIRRVPSILDRANTSGCVVVVKRGSDKAIVSLGKIPQGTLNPYIESVRYSFLGVTMGSVRQTARHAGVVVSGVATALHCQPRAYNKGDGPFERFMDVGARVAFEFPSDFNEKPGYKRAPGNFEQIMFDDDGIRIRRSYLTRSKAEQRDYVDGRISGRWDLLAQALGVPFNGTLDEQYELAYLAERNLTFGQALSNIKSSNETNALRLLITPP